MTQTRTSVPHPPPPPPPQPPSAQSAPTQAPFAGPTASGGAFCRITVAGPDTRVDLSVPSGVPLARLMPTLLHHVTTQGQSGVGGGGGGAVGGASGGTDAAGWALRTADGTRLDGGATLAAAGVREGAVLVLHPASEYVAPPVYDDVVEIVQSGGVRNAWASPDVRRACAVVASLAVLGALAAVATAGGTLVPGVLAGSAAVLLVLVGGALSRAVGDAPAGTLATALAAPAAAMGATALLDGSWGRGHLLLAGVAVAVVAALGPAVVGDGDGVFAALGIVGLAAAAGALVAVLADARPAQAAAVVAPLALAATTVLPTIALRAARLPRAPLPRTAEDLASVQGHVDLERTRAQVDQARRLLSGLVAGCQLATAGGVVLLVVDGQTRSRILAAVLAMLVLLRGRLFRERAQVWSMVSATAAMLAAGIAVLIGQFSGDSGALLGVTAPLLVGIAVVAAVIGGASGRGYANPRLVRLTDIVETLLMLSSVPLVLAVWDVYQQLIDLRA